MHLSGFYCTIPSWQNCRILLTSGILVGCMTGTPSLATSSPSSTRTAPSLVSESFIHTWTPVTWLTSQNSFSWVCRISTWKCKLRFLFFSSFIVLKRRIGMKMVMMMMMMMMMVKWWWWWWWWWSWCWWWWWWWNHNENDDDDDDNVMMMMVMVVMMMKLSWWWWWWWWW